MTCSLKDKIEFVRYKPHTQTNVKSEQILPFLLAWHCLQATIQIHPITGQGIFTHLLALMVSVTFPWWAKSFVIIFVSSSTP